MPTLVDIVCACQCMQVVILAGGTNDFHTAPTPLDEWVSDAIELIQNVSTDHLLCVCELSLSFTLPSQA